LGIQLSLPEGVVETFTDDIDIGRQSATGIGVCSVGLVNCKRYAVLHFYSVHSACLALAEMGILALLRRPTDS